MARTLGLHRYGPVMRTPGARGLLFWTIVGRTGQFGMGLALLLAVHAQTGSFGIAGTATGLLTVGAASSRIPQGRLADRRGTRPLLLVGACAFALLSAALVLAVSSGAGTLVTFALSLSAGGTMPATGAITRALWAELVPDANARVSAYALDALGMETASTVGPTLAGLLAALASPTFALALLAATMSLGTLALARSRVVGVRVAAATRGTGGVGRALTGLIAISLTVGLMAGAIEVAVPAFATAHDSAELTGFVLACWAAGSVLGGMWYGTRRWRARHETILVGFLVGITAGCALLPLATSVGTLAAFLIVLGLSSSPALTTIYLLIDDRAPAERLAEAGAWILTALPTGVALGSVLCGWVVAADGARSGFVLAALLSLIPVAIAARMAHQARRAPAPAPA